MRCSIGVVMVNSAEMAVNPIAVVDAALTTGVIGLIIAAAGVFGWVLALEQVPQLVVAWVQSMTSSPLVAVLLREIPHRGHGRLVLRRWNGVSPFKLRAGRAIGQPHLVPACGPAHPAA